MIEEKKSIVSIDLQPRPARPVFRPLSDAIDLFDGRNLDLGESLYRLIHDHSGALGLSAQEKEDYIHQIFTRVVTHRSKPVFHENFWYRLGEMPLATEKFIFSAGMLRDRELCPEALNAWFKKLSPPQKIDYLKQMLSAYPCRVHQHMIDMLNVYYGTSIVVVSPAEAKEKKESYADRVRLSGGSPIASGLPSERIEIILEGLPSNESIVHINMSGQYKPEEPLLLHVSNPEEDHEDDSSSLTFHPIPPGLGHLTLDSDEDEGPSTPGYSRTP